MCCWVTFYCKGDQYFLKVVKKMFDPVHALCPSNWFFSSLYCISNLAFIMFLLYFLYYSVVSPVVLRPSSPTLPFVSVCVSSWSRMARRSPPSCPVMAASTTSRKTMRCWLPALVVRVTPLVTFPVRRHACWFSFCHASSVALTWECVAWGVISAHWGCMYSTI